MSRLLTVFAALFVVIAAYLLLQGQQGHNSATNLPHAVSSNGSVEIVPIVATSEVPNFQNWREFASQSGHFKILLPALPQHVTDTVADPKTQQPRKYETFAAASDNGAAFMINAITFITPREADTSEESLKAVITDMLDRNKENKLNTITASSFHGDRALDFSLSNGDILIEGKVFAHGKTMYILSMINKKDTFNKQELDFFINSFDFVEEESSSSEGVDSPVKTK